jgi:DNA-binding response OmpR family regulator
VPLKVAYIDDEQDLCDIFKEMFATPQVDVDVYSDSSAGIAACQKKTYDILFLDYRLPGTTGDEVAKRIPAGPRIYLMTGENNPVTSYPFVAILPKPFDYPAIEAIIKAGS